MGIKISTLKTLGKVRYFVAALALVLTSAPFVIPSGSAAAAQLYDCVNDAAELTSRFGAFSQTRTASLCSKIENYYEWWGTRYKQTLTAYGDSILDLNDNTIESNITTSDGSWFSSGGTLTIVGKGLVDGTLSAGNGGQLIIRGGTYTSNPTNYVDTASGYRAYSVDNNRWMVALETEVTANDVVVPVGVSAELFTVSPAEVNDPEYEVIGTTSPDGVTISEEVEDDVITGTVYSTQKGSYTFNIFSNGKSDSSSLTFYEYDDEIADQVIFAKDNEPLDVADIFSVDDGIEYTLESGDEAVATVDGTEVTGVASGETTITIKLADSVDTTVTFNLKVYDFYADKEALLVEKGGSLAIRPDTKWETELAEGYDEDIVTVNKSGNEYTVTGEEVGKTELTFTLDNRRHVVTVYVYDIASTELWVAAGESAAIDVEFPGDEYTLTAVSSDPYIAEFTGTDYENINGLKAGDATITYTVTLGDQAVDFDVAVHVYEIEIEEEIYLLSGTTVNVNDPAISTTKNGEAISIRMSRGGDGAVTLQGDNAENGVITAGDESGDDVIIFYVGDEELGRTTVHVFTVEEMEDVLLSVSGRGADRQINVSVDGENLPDYTIASSDEGIVSVENGSLNAESAGDATITVTFDAYGEPETTFDVKVSDFHTNIRNSYDLAEGSEPAVFTVSEEYDQAEISCKVDNTDCAESDALNVEIDDNGEVTVSVKEGARGGDYRITFTDEMLPSNNTVSATITVREIIIDETEYYLEVGESTTINIDTRGGNWADRISASVIAADGGAINNANVTCILGYCTLRANKAGQYVVEVRDTNFWGTEVYATKYITLYVIDFTVEDAEYHVVKGDTGMHLVKALNEYWEKTNAEGVSGVAVWQKPGSSSEYAFVLDENTEAGDYDLSFYAYAGPDMDVVRDTKTVTVHVYEMIAQGETVDGYAEDDYYGEWFGSFNVNVHDENALGRVTHVTEGRTGGLIVINNTVVNILPGKYTVTYTDRMNNGRGDVVGTYVANFEFFNLATYAQDETIIEPGETFEYDIIDTLTYGDIYTTVTRDGEVIAEGEGTDPLDIDTSEEGKYEITIVNESAEEHGFDETDTYYFYVVASEIQTIFVKQGDSTVISSASTWSVDNATDETTDEEYVAEDNEVEVDTTEMDLGTHEFVLTHEFETGEIATLKIANVIVYKVTPDETTDPEAITEETIKNLFDALNEAITDEDWEALIQKAQSIFGDDVEGLEAYMMTLLNARFGFEMNTEVVVTDINDSVSEEDVAAIAAALEGIDVDHIDYYDISVIISSNGDPFGKLHQLDGAITVAVARAEDPAEGYTRQYFVIAKHGDSEEAIMLVEGTDFYILDGQIYVISDKFSTFAVAYKDTLKPKAPDTGNFTAMVGGNANTVSANTVAIVAVMIAAVVALVGAVRFAKKR